jgi:hypothetical protein
MRSRIDAEPTLVISFDLELAWGSFDIDYGPELLARAEWTCERGVPIILEHLSRNQLAATWAIVGFVMLDGLPIHAELTEVRYAHFHHPWLSYASSADAKSQAWFAPRVVESICKRRPAQEIGAHSLSHILFGDQGTPRKRAEEELNFCQSIAQTLGFELESFVFPRNSVAHLDALKAAGFTCYRSPDVLPFLLPIPYGAAICALACDVLGISPRPVRPVHKNGLVEIPGSLMIRDMKDWRGLIPDRVRLRRLRQGLKIIANEGGIYHIWLHPESLFDRRPRMEMILAEFLDEAGAMVGAGQIRSLNMGQLAAEVRAAQTDEGETQKSIPVQTTGTYAAHL